MTPPDSRAAAAMWSAYLASGRGPGPRAPVPVVDGFGDGPVLADELLGLVLSGVKRATASLLDEYEVLGDTVPEVGDHWIVCDGTGMPRVILRTTEVRRVRFREVDAAFAYDEGEGDRSIESWRRGHRRCWERVGAELGLALTNDSVVVAERFRVVWPPEDADA